MSELLFLSLAQSLSGLAILVWPGHFHFSSHFSGAPSHSSLKKHFLPAERSLSSKLPQMQPRAQMGPENADLTGTGNRLELEENNILKTMDAQWASIICTIGYYIRYQWVFFTSRFSFPPWNHTLSDLNPPVRSSHRAVAGCDQKFPDIIFQAQQYAGLDNARHLACFWLWRWNCEGKKYIFNIKHILLNKKADTAYRHH